MKLLHLSDLHLGKDLLWRSLTRLRPWWKNPSKEITDGLKDAIRKLQPDYIVISGDFVNKPDERSFRQAARYVRDMLADCGFDIRRRLLVIPGNHDASFAPQAQPDAASRLREYRRFMRALFNEDDVEARKPRYVHRADDEPVVFACLDSTLKDLAPLAEGEVGPGQLRWLERKVKELKLFTEDPGQLVKIAVVHHHCIPIKGSSPRGERFMPLLDAGDVLAALNTHGFHLVLHGHKHHPNVAIEYRSDGSMLVVVGAGTATCPYVDEQNQFGNNFNFLTISHALNRITLQRYKADGVGVFNPDGEERRFPIFRNVQGYGVRMLRKTVNIDSDGTIEATVYREGIRVDDPGKTISEVEYQVAVVAQQAKIESFSVSTDTVTAKPKSSTPVLRSGLLVFNKPLTAASDPVTAWYSYKIVGGTAMSLEQAETMYAAKTTTESTAAIVTVAAELLEIEINFPQDFPVQPTARIEHFGSLVQPSPSIRREHPQNRWVVKYPSPGINHRVIVEWGLPAKWPL